MKKWEMLVLLSSMATMAACSKHNISNEQSADMASAVVLPVDDFDWELFACNREDTVEFFESPEPELELKQEPVVSYDYAVVTAKMGNQLKYKKTGVENDTVEYTFEPAAHNPSLKLYEYISVGDTISGYNLYDADNYVVYKGRIMGVNGKSLRKLNRMSGWKCAAQTAEKPKTAAKKTTGVSTNKRAKRSSHRTSAYRAARGRQR